MPPEVRDQLTAQAEFIFAYDGWMGNRHSVRFKQGKVASVEGFSK